MFVNDVDNWYSIVKDRARQKIVSSCLREAINLSEQFVVRIRQESAKQL